MRRLFKNFQVRIITVLLISIIPILAYEFYVYAKYKKIIESQIESVLQNNLNMIGGQIENLYSDIIRLSNLIASDDIIKNELSKKAKSRRKIENELIKIKESSLFNFKSDVLIISKKGEVFLTTENDEYLGRKHNTEVYNVIKNSIANYYKDSKWYEEINETKDEYIWVAPYRYMRLGTRYISLVRKVYDGNKNKVLGYIMINVEEANFIEFARQEDWNFVILYNNKTGREIFSYVDNFVYTKDYLNFRHKDSNNFYLIAATLRSKYLGDTEIMGKRIILYNLLLFVVFAFVASFTIFHVTSPLKVLINKIRKSNIGHYKVEEDEILLKNDIQSIAITYDYLFNRIDELAKKSIEDNKRESELKYIALQNQINPHFLFNTLNNIKFSAMISGEEHIVKMITELGKLLEITFNNEEEITLGEEIDLLKSYMYIQNLRFGGKFSFYVNIREELLSLKILKLILQPLVENSINHGFKNKTRGSIFIDGEEKDGYLYLIIRDDGVGFKKQNIDTKNKFSGIGMSNVDERIKMRFGDEYGIYIEAVNIGTKIKMILPIAQEEISN
ncbi:MAG: sensor histidine kinase [Lachnospirales bacterium]